jgi:hypothetical protein
MSDFSLHRFEGLNASVLSSDWDEDALKLPDVVIESMWDCTTENGSKADPTVDILHTRLADRHYSSIADVGSDL